MDKDLTPKQKLEMFLQNNNIELSITPPILVPDAEGRLVFGIQQITVNEKKAEALTPKPPTEVANGD